MCGSYRLTPSTGAPPPAALTYAPSIQLKLASLNLAWPLTKPTVCRSFESHSADVIRLCYYNLNYYIYPSTIEWYENKLGIQKVHKQSISILVGCVCSFVHAISTELRAWRHFSLLVERTLCSFTWWSFWSHVTYLTLKNHFNTVRLTVLYFNSRR